MNDDTIAQILDLCKATLTPGRWSEEKTLASKILKALDAEVTPSWPDGSPASYFDGVLVVPDKYQHFQHPGVEDAVRRAAETVPGAGEAVTVAGGSLKSFMIHPAMLDHVVKMYGDAVERAITLLSDRAGLGVVPITDELAEVFRSQPMARFEGSSIGTVADLEVDAALAEIKAADPEGTAEERTAPAFFGLTCSSADPTWRCADCGEPAIEWPHDGCSDGPAKMYHGVKLTEGKWMRVGTEPPTDAERLGRRIAEKANVPVEPVIEWVKRSEFFDQTDPPPGFTLDPDEEPPY